MGLLTLEGFVLGFAEAIRVVDARQPQAVSSRSGNAYIPGIGPHSESETLRLIVQEMDTRVPALESGWRLNVPYGSGTRQTCDLCIGTAPSWDWAIEAKLLRLFGDNGKLNDAMLMHILSPYPQHRSALTDCAKLANSMLAQHKAILLFGYDFPGWEMDPAIEAFEALANLSVTLSARISAGFEGLVHPVHTTGRVFAWEIRSSSH